MEVKSTRSMSLQKRITEIQRTQSKGLVLLMDPDKLEGVHLKQRLEFAKEFAEFILLGGSMTHELIERETIKEIRDITGKPVVLFPADSMHVHPDADAILFLSLLSGRNPEYLVGKQVTATPFIQKTDLEVLPTSYILVGTGRPTTAEYITQTTPVPANKPEIAATTALAGEYLGKSLTYLDAGSGAENPIPPEVVKMVRQNTSLPLIIGGGIREADKAEGILEAGADLIVIGNLMEENPDAGIDIALMIKENSLPQD